MKNFFKTKLLLLNPRKIVCPLTTIRRYYDDYDIKSLADNISANGIIEPLIIRENEAGKYELVSGLRRLKAATVLSLRRVPCLLIDATEEDGAFISLSENIKRTSLNFFEEAQAIKQIMNRFDTPNSSTCDRLGISYSSLQNKLNLLTLKPQIRERIINSGLSEKHARIILQIPEEKQEIFLQNIIRYELDIARTRKLAEKILLGEDEIKEEKEQLSEPQIKRVANCDARLFANSLSKLIDTMKNTGLEAYSRKTETEKYIEYKVRIIKPQADNFRQLRLV